jgi:RimJ/RimL family protein N-acetyltransferase
MTFGSGTMLRTHRLTLRPFGEEDIDAVVAAAADPEMLRWMPWAAGQTPASGRAWCTVHAHEDPEHSIHFAIVPNDDAGGDAGGDAGVDGGGDGGGHGGCAGSIGLVRAAWDGGRVEIGYWIASWARRRGYAVEAVRAVTTYAFRAGLHRVELLAATGNHASQGVAIKAGFTREGVLREALVVPGGRANAVLFGLLAGDVARDVAGDLA